VSEPEGPEPGGHAPSEDAPAERTSSGGPFVLMADRSLDARPVAEALRERGFAVLTCDVVALPERVARTEPLAVVVDLEEAHAEAVVARLTMERVASGRGPALLALGAPAVAAELELSSSDGDRSFPRPLKIAALCEHVADLAAKLGAVPQPSSMGSFPQAPDSDATPFADFPAIAGLPELASILPDVDGGVLSTRAGMLSPEIEALLEDSARRVRDGHGEALSVQQESNVLVPSGMLSALDELLAPDEDEPATRGHSSSSWGGRAPDGRSSSVPGAMDATPEVPLAEASEQPLTGIHEPTSVRGPRTQVGSSGSRDPSPSQPPDDPPRPLSGGSRPPLHERTVADFKPPAADSYPPPPRADDSRRAPFAPSPSARPPRAQITELMATWGASGAVSDEPPDSVAAPSEMAPFSMAQLGAQGPRSARDSQPPRTSLGGPTFVDGDVPDSTQVEQGDPIELLARAVSGRVTGALLLSSLDGRRLRRILVRDGDMVSAASENREDALVTFLVERGDLGPDVAAARGQRLPPTGRHAAAALIANGYLSQDDLWPVLRAHAEWIIGRALRDTPALGRVEREPPERLRAEPNVFGGAAGVEIFVESVRRVLPPDEALGRLGGESAQLAEGRRSALLAESALSVEEVEIVRGSPGRTVGQVCAMRGSDFASVLYALTALEVLVSQAERRARPAAAAAGVDPLDADAVRQRVRARMALVNEGDYFAVLGLTPSATPYEIRRAYVELRRVFEPNRLLTAATADLRSDLELILDVLEEAYEILRDPTRRTRYQKAIQATRSAD
jgi:DnaJ-like protein